MSSSAVVLFGLIGWSVLLTLMVVAVRLKPILAGTLLFQQDGSDLPGLAQRVTRAHGNSLENLAIPAALILYGLTTGQSAVTDGLAMVLLGARIGQSLVHIASAARTAVVLRATLFFVQVVIWAIWILNLYSA
ncbi:MAG: MAPEG family protein [Pseudomonadales bacterium]|nr:MAPEG family protein [Pseudomonadales bacterium]